MKIFKFNKRADFASIVYVVIFLFVVAIAFFFLSHVNNEIFIEINSTLHEYNDSEDGGALGHSEPFDVTEGFISMNNSVWDYAFLGIFIGVLIALGLTAYAVRISPVFYWIYGIMSMTVLALGAMLSNIWQGMVADPTFTTTLTRFPITDLLLGTYYPVVVTALIVLTMIILFGKPASQQEGFI